MNTQAQEAMAANLFQNSQQLGNFLPEWAPPSPQYDRDSGLPADQSSSSQEGQEDYYFDWS